MAIPDMAYIKLKKNPPLTRKQTQYALKLAAAMYLSKNGGFPMLEVSLNHHLRADLFCVSKHKSPPHHQFVIVEVKSCPADFKRDTKWSGYLNFCDRFYFCGDPKTIETIRQSIEHQYPQVGFIAVKDLQAVRPESARMIKDSKIDHPSFDREETLYRIARTNCLFYQGFYRGLRKVNLDAIDQRYRLDAQSDLGGLI